MGTTLQMPPKEIERQRIKLWPLNNDGLYSIGCVTNGLNQS